MALIISSPLQGSLKVQNTNPSASVSPDSFYTNLSTTIVEGDPNYQTNSPIIGAVILRNVEGNIATFPLASISAIAASTQTFGLKWAVDSVAGLIMK